MTATGAARARTTTKTAALTVPIFKASGKGHVVKWRNIDLLSCMPLTADIAAFNELVGIFKNAVRAYYNPKG